MNKLFEIKNFCEKENFSKGEYNYVLSIILDETNINISEKILKFKILEGENYSENNFLLYAGYLNDKIGFATLDYASFEKGPQEFYSIKDNVILEEIHKYIKDNISLS